MLFFAVFGAVFKVSSKKAECVVGFLGNIGDVCCPFKIIRYLQSNVWVILHLLQDVTAQIVVSLALVFFSKYVTFLRVEAHSPILGPYFQFLQIFLKDCVVLLCPDVSIEQAVVGKKSD